MLKAINFEKAIAWIAARLKEPSTQRSIPLFICGAAGLVVAVKNNEPGTACASIGVMIYTAMNASTPENPQP
jgi:hypothetical protein